MTSTIDLEKKVKVDAQAISWRFRRVERRGRSMNGGSEENGFWSLDVFGVTREGGANIVTRV